MDLALKQARAAADRGEVPVGAVITGSRGAVIAATGNRTIELQDPTAHAEVLAIRKNLSEGSGRRRIERVLCLHRSGRMHLPADL